MRMKLKEGDNVLVHDVRKDVRVNGTVVKVNLQDSFLTYLVAFSSSHKEWFSYTSRYLKKT